MKLKAGTQEGSLESPKVLQHELQQCEVAKDEMACLRDKVTKLNATLEAIWLQTLRQVLRKALKKV